jgi:hypothetical protein
VRPSVVTESRSEGKGGYSRRRLDRPSGRGSRDFPRLARLALRMQRVPSKSPLALPRIISVGLESVARARL